MSRLLDWLYRRLRVAYFGLHLLVDGFAAALVCLGAVGLISIYQPMSVGEFWVIVGFSEAFVMGAFAFVALRATKVIWPTMRWVARGRTEEGAAEAWRAAVAFPREAVAQAGWLPFVIAVAPLAVFLTLRYDLPYYSVAIVIAGGMVAIAYAGILSFFVAESLLRPVLRDIASHLPPDFAAVPAGVPLRWKLLGSLPLINVVTGVVVSGLSTTGSAASLDDLGIDVVVAVVVAFTLSLELTALVTKSVLGPVRELLGATDRAARGDLSARVPVISGDELGRLASSFNAMMAGLAERERLQAAFGSYVDPDVAERVLAEGELLEGEELEATLMFVDVRDFTAFAERATARESVAQLNDFFGVVVPIVMRHGGHANKFIGDGLLAVFGAPERHPDHADRALLAACEIAQSVQSVFSDGVSIGVGINSGQVVAGSIGGGGRLEFTVIGDPVNVASRVEQATRELGDTILLTEATRTLLGPHAPALEPRGGIELRGKAEPVALYAIARASTDGCKDSSSLDERTKVET
ncbi:MAG: adenylate/guanylate cyclase domain-containing protein [Thermoleophilaceae bacterium]